MESHFVVEADQRSMDAAREWIRRQKIKGLSVDQIIRCTDSEISQILRNEFQPHSKADGFDRFCAWLLRNPIVKNMLADAWVCIVGGFDDGVEFVKH